MPTKKKRRRFRAFRKELKRCNISIAQLTEKCELSSSMAYSILNGEKLPSLKTGKLILKRLGLRRDLIEAWVIDFYKTSKDNLELGKLISRFQHFG